MFPAMLLEKALLEPTVPKLSSLLVKGLTYGQRIAVHVQNTFSLVYARLTAHSPTVCPTWLIPTRAGMDQAGQGSMLFVILHFLLRLQFIFVSLSTHICSYRCMWLSF